MKRREAISRVTLLVSGTLVGSQVVFYSCKPHPKATSGIMTEKDIAFMNEVAETIIPETPSSPGAKTAAVGDYMNAIVTDCFSPKDQKVFMDGIQKLDDAAKARYSKGFVDLDASQRHEFLVELDHEARSNDDGGRHYFSIFKRLTTRGYFTSEPGATKALAHVAVPGRYEACIPLKEGQKAWG